ncbi:hypothetical protein [uncultured Aquimarina sp.]|uniref:hypothetical protein n=1 Tax=uncultured Aquimarina sp. TaxID=575652 RepID=UPI00260B709C|nr:hypothetical protein [uncultured Aquimarina sp.]
MKGKYLLMSVILLLLFMQCKNCLETSNYYNKQDQKSVHAILKILDDHSISTEDKMDVWVDDLVHMAPGHPIITEKTSLIKHINNEKQYGTAEMKHEMIEMHSYDQIVVMHGKVRGVFFSANKDVSDNFETKNIFVFRRMKDNSLKIWKVIFNMTS